MPATEVEMGLLWSINPVVVQWHFLKENSQTIDKSRIDLSVISLPWLSIEKVEIFFYKLNYG